MNKSKIATILLVTFCFEVGYFRTCVIECKMSCTCMWMTERLLLRSSFKWISILSLLSKDRMFFYFWCLFLCCKISSLIGWKKWDLLMILRHFTPNLIEKLFCVKYFLESDHTKSWLFFNFTSIVRKVKR